ncbi:fimbrial biogenesis chaperone [Blastomonas fulva]|uniref:fimbrial biogenesis chaperone n=1 Tax=Blastomonas fulva TaxID=1550728 RepID=UPI003D2D2D84
MTTLFNRLRLRGPLTAVAIALTGLATTSASAQSLAILPVTIQMEPGQMATLLTVINQGPVETAVQIRAFSWNQADGTDQLVNSDDIMVSPPLATIQPGGTQIVRLVLRKPVVGREGTYRVLLDQIPPPAEPGVVRVALRMSLPVFAEPATRVAPELKFHIEHDNGQPYLVATNDGGSHEAIRDVVLEAANGANLKVDSAVSPYVLAGAKRRWPITRTDGSSPIAGAVNLTATTNTTPLKRSVAVVEHR